MKFSIVTRYIIQNEGGRGLFKGLGPNLVGVAPSRAIYFCAYAQSKAFLNDVFEPETPIVHILSAACAGKKRPILNLIIIIITNHSIKIARTCLSFNFYLMYVLLLFQALQPRLLQILFGSSKHGYS